MEHEDFADEIRDLNLSFLVLAQRMVQRDPIAAAVKLGLEAETVRWIAALSPAKLVRMASLQIGLPQFRFDAEVLERMAGEKARDELTANLHAAILAHGNPRKKTKQAGGHHEES
ncbi:flagellar transcriptional regulator FlhD [Tepidiphilus olei]|uniref:flagellar transcriptional regulator FlhD n=1 Tax=Tepidiphilus olei TaxID=2502184 RepID=UPI00115CEDC8|nr:flagellar transcriptional regulator FlhD [Tepidiphilus olei]